MRMQASSKEIRNCVKCDQFIMRSDRRYVDGCLHYHLNCEDKPVEEPFSFIRWILIKLNK